MKKLIRNRLKCKLCGDIIESTHGHDWNSCSCEACFIDGGLNYVRWGARSMDDIELMPEYEGEDE